MPSEQESFSLSLFAKRQERSLSLVGRRTDPRYACKNRGAEEKGSDRKTSEGFEQRNRLVSMHPRDRDSQIEEKRIRRSERRVVKRGKEGPVIREERRRVRT